MKWISVKEKLPDNLSNVLVWFTGIYNEPKIAFFAAGDFFPNTFSSDNISKWVSHWMPLPPAPEKE